MSMVMASHADCTEDTVPLQTNGGVSPVEENLEEVETRLTTMSENINVCNRVLNDLKDLCDIIKRKSLQDVPLPPQK